MIMLNYINPATHSALTFKKYTTEYHRHSKHTPDRSLMAHKVRTWRRTQLKVK